MNKPHYSKALIGVLLWLAASRLNGDQAWDDAGRLNRRDFSPIKAAYEARDLKMLWHFFETGVGGQYAGGRTDAEGGKALLSREQSRQLSQEIRDQAAKFLILVPGHAKHLGDQIAALGIEAEAERSRRFSLLGHLGGVEAIQQIGRFMFHEYVFYPPSTPMPQVTPSHSGTVSFIATCGNENHSRQPTSNGEMAAKAMRQAVRGQMPPSSGMFGSSPDRSLFNIGDWWRSEASLPYRQPLPGVELPEHVRHPPSAAEVEAQRQAVIGALSARSPQPLPWFVVVLRLACVAGLLFWLKLNRLSPALRRPAEVPADG